MENHICPNCDVEMDVKETADGTMIACGICSYGWYAEQNCDMSKGEFR